MLPREGTDALQHDLPLEVMEAVSQGEGVVFQTYFSDEQKHTLHFNYGSSGWASFAEWAAQQAMVVPVFPIPVFLDATCDLQHQRADECRQIIAQKHVSTEELGPLPPQFSSGRAHVQMAVNEIPQLLHELHSPAADYVHLCSVPVNVHMLILSVFFRNCAVHIRLVK